MTDRWNGTPPQHGPSDPGAAPPGSYGPGPGQGAPPWTGGGPGPGGPTSLPAQPGRRTPLWIGIAIGLVVAVVVGAVLVFADVVRFGNSAAAGATDITAVELPATLAGLRDTVEVVREKSPDNAAMQQQRDEKNAALTVERYRQAFGDVGVGVRSYTDDALEVRVTVIAVRAPSPGLFTGPVADLEILKLAAGPQFPEVVVSGDVQCLVISTQTVPAGQQVDPDELRTTTCRRASADLTVYLHGNAQGDQGRQQMVSATNAAFDAVAGGAS